MIRQLQIYLFATMAVLLQPISAFAQDGNCTTDNSFVTPQVLGEGIIAGILGLINQILAISGQQMYEYIINNPDYVNIVSGMVLLMVAVFGVLILFDIIRPSLGTIISKIITIGFIVWLISPAGWDFFNSIVVEFFLGGMNDLLQIFTEQALSVASGAGGVNAPPTPSPDHPLWILNQVFSMINSKKFTVMLLGTALTGPYGFILALVIVWASICLIFTLVSAMFIYIKSLVGLWFLFGLAPFFIIMLLFERTKKIFDGWLNLVIFLALLPILTFAFLLFFLTIVMYSLDRLLQVEWCWATFEVIRGLPFQMSWWRPYHDPVTGLYFDPNAAWLFNGSGNTGPVFPLDILDILFFLLASYIGWQYNKQIENVAREMAQAGVSMGNAHQLQQYFKVRGWTPGGVAGKLAYGAGEYGIRFGRSVSQSIARSAREGNAMRQEANYKMQVQRKMATDKAYERTIMDDYKRYAANSPDNAGGASFDTYLSNRYMDSRAFQEGFKKNKKPNDSSSET